MSSLFPLHTSYLWLIPESSNLSSGASVASAPTIIAGGGLSTRNNSVATGQTNYSTTSAPVQASAIAAASARRRSSLTHAMWLHSLPLPAFGAPLAMSQEQQDPEDPLAPLNLSSAKVARSQYTSNDDAELSALIVSAGQDGHAYIAQTPGPSSAPASPGLLCEPSQYIHTHLPRRASLTPANLNLVGPVPPSPSVIEQVRRESLALLGPTMPPAGTASAAPGTFPMTEPFAQMHWGARRKSTTNTTTLATGSLAMASPTKLNATGAISRKSVLGSALGVGGDVAGRSHSAGGRGPSPELGRSSGAPKRSIMRPATAEGYAGERRGSAFRMSAEDSGTSSL